MRFIVWFVLIPIGGGGRENKKFTIGARPRDNRFRTILNFSATRVIDFFTRFCTAIERGELCGFKSVPGKQSIRKMYGRPSCFVGVVSAFKRNPVQESRTNFHLAE